MVSRSTGVLQLQMRVSRYPVMLWYELKGKLGCSFAHIPEFKSSRAFVLHDLLEADETRLNSDRNWLTKIWRSWLYFLRGKKREKLTEIALKISRGGWSKTTPKQIFTVIYWDLPLLLFSLTWCWSRLEDPSQNPSHQRERESSTVLPNPKEMCTAWGLLLRETHSEAGSVNSETFRWPQPPVFFQKYCRTNGGRTAVQMGRVLQYKWEAYCRVSLSSKLRSQESTAIQMGGVLPYKLEVYCRTV